MAKRPVFSAASNGGIIVREDIEFEYFSGFSLAQSRRCINSLHQAYLKKHPGKRILEISSKSEQELGVELSAFNLTLKDKEGREYSVECAFQGGKVFERGGPYTDLLEVSSRDAKRDERLKSSGRIVAFEYDGKRFPAEPKTLFYNWLYVSALCCHDELAEQLLECDAFTDIVFNPQKSVNCQAEAAAVYVSLTRRGLLDQTMADTDIFKRIVFDGLA